MESIFQFFKYVSENFGTTFAMAVLLIAGIWSGIIFIIKTFPDLINEHVENNLISASEAHRKGTIIRKNISPKINKILSDLVIETEGDRAIIFEFSNGTSNLAGLPFLFVNATYEAISYRTVSVAASYQRVNVSLIADFILDLEDNNFYFCESIEEMRETCPYIYNALHSGRAKSAIFYSIYGVNNKLGFIALTSISKIFDKNEVLPEIAEAAQRVSSLLNFEELEEGIN